MKKLSILVVLTPFLLVSCIKDYAVKTEFIIKNESNHLVKMEVKNFTNNSEDICDTVFILNSGSQWKNIYDGKLVYSSPLGYKADTVVLIFDQTDTILYTLLNKSNRNILHIDNFKEEEIEKHSYQYTYKITETDYQNAKKH